MEECKEWGTKGKSWQEIRRILGEEEWGRMMDEGGKNRIKRGESEERRGEGEREKGDWRELNVCNPARGRV